MLFFFFFKQKTAYEMRISNWSSDVCSSDLLVDQELRSATMADGLAMAIGIHEPLHRRAILRQLCGRVGHQDRSDRIEQHRGRASELPEIGRASCRERVCQSV